MSGKIRTSHCSVLTRLLDKMAVLANRVGWYVKSAEWFQLALLCLEDASQGNNYGIIGYTQIISPISPDPVKLYRSSNSHLHYRLLETFVESADAVLIWRCSLLSIKAAVKEMTSNPEILEYKLFAGVLLDKGVSALVWSSTLLACDQRSVECLVAMRNRPYSQHVARRWRKTFEDILKKTTDWIKLIHSCTRLPDLSVSLEAAKQHILNGDSRKVLEIYLSCLNTDSYFPPKFNKELEDESQRCLCEELSIAAHRLYFILLVLTADLCLVHGDFEDARVVLEPTLSELEGKYKNAIRIDVSHVHDTLSRVFHQKGDLSTALQHAAKAVDILKTIFGNTSNAQLSRTLTHYNVLVRRTQRH